MPILTEIPFVLEEEALFKQARLEPDADEADDFRALIAKARELGRPKAAYGVAFITERTEETVTFDGVVFTSRTLSRNLAASERVFPILATCGRELDDAGLVQGDPLAEFWLDQLKANLLLAANRFLLDLLRRQFRLEKTSIMRPGSGDATIWPIQQQHELFALLGDGPAAIGVELTDSCLMIPNKTTSGLLFPTEKDFRNCEVCHRADCPSRQAPFSQQLWNELQLS